MEQVTDIYQKITDTMPNFMVRHSQLAMAKKIYSCYTQTIKPENNDGSNICLIEAPTGTGKSLAYLLAGVLAAQLLDKKYIIATATKALQAQLIDKDIPNFIRYSGINFSYAQAVGRSNYLCPYQLEISLSNSQPDFFTTTNSDRDILTQLSELFASGRWNGDLSEAPIVLNNKIKPLITIDNQRCLNSLCPFNQKDSCSCPYFRKRAQLKGVDVVVTNHNLLLSDITLGGGVVLPFAPENYLLCIDEGHKFADIATDSFMASFVLKESIMSCTRMGKFIYDKDTQSYLPGIEVSLCSEASDFAHEITTELDKIHRLLKDNLSLFKEQRLILNDYLQPGMEIFKEYFANCVYNIAELLLRTTKIEEKLKQSIKDKTDHLAEANLTKLGFYQGELEKILTTSQYIINKDDSRYNANARWVDIKSYNSGESDFVITAGLTHVGKILVDKIFSRVYAASIVSATLAVNNKFDYYLNRLGLTSYLQTKLAKLSSSFNYTKQAQIVVPKFNYTPEYGSNQEFTQELANYLLTRTLNYSDGYGTLVLFFNKVQAQAVYNLLSEEVRSNILLQTDFISTQRLINQHKRRIDEGKPSIIFGLNSFAEGVDLPSLYCIHVVITKLPFELYNNPLNVVQEYWFNFEGASFFGEVTLPETCIKLVQAAGRLIRDEADYGQLTICDNRLIRKAYGTMLLNSLPEFNRNYDKNFLSNSYDKIKSLVMAMNNN
jgi:ATP-dependent DNA helicase DinG